jgi:hypothetical protein
MLEHRPNADGKSIHPATGIAAQTARKQPLKIAIDKPFSVSC